MTSRLIGRFVVAVEQATRAEHGPGPLTRHGGRLVVPREARAECAVLKAVAAHYVMHAAERVALHVRQREVVAELVAAFEADPDRLDPDLRRDWDDAAGDDARAAGARRPGGLAHRRAGADPAPAVVPPGDDLDSRAVERHPRGGVSGGSDQGRGHRDGQGAHVHRGRRARPRDPAPGRGGQPEGAVPLPRREDPELHRAPDRRQLPLLRLRRGRRRHLLRAEGRAPHLHRVHRAPRRQARARAALRGGRRPPRGRRLARQALAADRGAPGRAGVLRRAAARHRPPRRPGRP